MSFMKVSYCNVWISFILIWNGLFKNNVRGSDVKVFLNVENFQRNDYLVKIVNKYNLTHDEDAPVELLYDGERLSAKYMGDSEVYVDFTSGQLRWRKNHGGGEAIARAVGVKSNYHPYVIDATGGFGTDAFILSSHGCKVKIYENNPIVACLLENGLERAYGDKEIGKEIRNQLTFTYGDSLDYLKQLANLKTNQEKSTQQNITSQIEKSFASILNSEGKVFQTVTKKCILKKCATDEPSKLSNYRTKRRNPSGKAFLFVNNNPNATFFSHNQIASNLSTAGNIEFPDVIYLDPMFPKSKNSALVKKHIKFLQNILPYKYSNNDQLLIHFALKCCKKRVVVKRPFDAPCLGDIKTVNSVRSNKYRFDIYSPNHL